MKQLMVGKAKDHYDALEDQELPMDQLIAKSYEFANKRRLDARKSNSAMEAAGSVPCTNRL